MAAAEGSKSVDVQPDAGHGLQLGPGGPAPALVAASFGAALAGERATVTGASLTQDVTGVLPGGSAGATYFVTFLPNPYIQKGGGTTGGHGFAPPGLHWGYYTDCGTLTVDGSSYTYCCNTTFFLNVHCYYTGAAPPPGYTPIVGPNGSITWTVPNGTALTYLLLGQPGLEVTGVAPYGNVSVDGANVSVAFAFTKGPTATLQYHETGLTPGTLWCAPFQNCTTKSSLSLKDLTPGTYPYGVSSPGGYTSSATLRGATVPSSGWTNVGKSGASFHVKYSPVLYAVTFNQTGLPSGTAWHIKATCTTPKKADNTTSCDGFHARSLGQKTWGDIVLTLRNGTYNWSVTPVKGYSLSVDGTAGWSGSLAVAGENEQISLTFTKI